MAKLPFTQHSLNKLEALLKDLGFRVRYEKGNFRTGACVLQNGRVVVVNKFLDLEGRISSLIEVLNESLIDSFQPGQLDEKQKELLLNIKQKTLEI